MKKKGKAVVLTQEQRLRRIALTFLELHDEQQAARSKGGNAADTAFKRARTEDEKLWLKAAMSTWSLNPHQSCAEIGRQLHARDMGGERAVADFLRRWKRNNVKR